MPSTAFRNMMGVYRAVFGRTYPKEDPSSVAAVFQHCGQHPGASQDEICKAEHLRPSNVNKIVARACKSGWMEVDKTRTGGRRKPVRLTPVGQAVWTGLQERWGAAMRQQRRKSSSRGRRRRRLRAPEGMRPLGLPEGSTGFDSE